jgi:hypothetical protein
MHAADVAVINSMACWLCTEQRTAAGMGRAWPCLHIQLFTLS